MKTNMKVNAIVILAITLIGIAVMASGCISNDNAGTDGDQVTEQAASEDDLDSGDSTDDGQTPAQTPPEDNTTEAVQTDIYNGNVTVSKDATEQTSATNEAQVAPDVELQASALGSGKYLLEHKGGDDMNLAEVRLFLSSHGVTSVYSPISENDVIMKTGDELVIDTSSGIFTINDEQIDVTVPETTESSVGDTGIIFIHIDSDQMIAYMTVSG